VNGLAGDGATKFLRTGFIPSTGYVSALSAGACVYCYVASATGATSGSTDNVGYLELIGKFSDNNAYSRIGIINNLVQVASPGNGFYSCQRINNNDHRLYFASSLSPHAQIGLADVLGSGGVMSPVLVDLYRFNGAGLSAADTISFYAFTTGLTAADDAKLFARVQTLRMALLGGFR